jgi:pyrophosphatase PpaX
VRPAAAGESVSILSVRAPLEAVLFDWDGTLIDSASATFECYRQVFESYSIAFDRQRFEETYSPDWYETYRRVGLSEEHWTEADEHWLDLYSRQHVQSLPQAAPVLTSLAHAGLRLGVVTSGDRRRVARETAELGLDRHLRTLVCAGEAPRPKPAPDPLIVALERIGVAAARAAYVGDSPEDIRMARAARVCAIGIPGGFPNRDALVTAAPDFLADSLTSAAACLLAAAGTRDRSL